MADRWSEFRTAMPVSRSYAYFDHAAVAPLSQPACDALSKWAGEACHSGDMEWPSWSARAEQVRSSAAQMVGADPAEISFIANTTAGIHLVAEGFPWSEGDNVVAFANEFPSNLFPWLNLARRGVETRTVSVLDGRPCVERLLEACDERTRLISVSWVGYASGWRIGLDELVDRAHRRGILVMLDAIQGLGVFPLDVSSTPIDFFSADGHKWMLGPEGAGVFFLRHKHLDLLEPLGVGWKSVRKPYNYAHPEFELRPAASRYEGGSLNMPGIMAWGASLDLLRRFGVGPRESAVAERILDLVDEAAERLQQIGGEVYLPDGRDQRSGILSFALPGQDPVAVRKRCIAAGIVLSCRDGRLRISPHAYNDEADLDRLIDALSSN